MANGARIRGSRAGLCPFTEAFWEMGLAWYNDPEIIALTSDDPNPLDPEQFRQIIQADIDNEQSVVFGVLDEQDLPIGIAMLRSLDRQHRSADLHLTIGDRSRWGQGYGAEAIGLMCRHADRDLKLHKLISTPFAFNLRMVRCLRKCGFQQEGLLRDALWIGEQFVDVMILGRINPDERPEPEPPST